MDTDGPATGEVAQLAARLERERAERLRVEAALQQSELAYRAVIDNLGEGVAIVDPDEHIVVCNPAAERIFGVAPGQLVGKRVIDFMHPDEQAKVRSETAARELGRTSTYEHTVTRADGSLAHVLLTATPRHGPDGGFAGSFAVFRDMTAQKRLEAQIQQAQKFESIGVLAGGIAHDYNNLLVAILGNASLALMEVDQSTSAFACLQEIESAAIRASELTKQLLAYAGKGKFVTKSLYLGELVREMLHLLAVSISKKCRLVYDSDPDVPPVAADPGQVRQIVMNLISNAAEAIGDQAGTVTVHISTCPSERSFLDTFTILGPVTTGAYVLLEVRDTGCGMDVATVERVFDPFFSTKFTGRGLGLAAVHGIVRSHGGAIKVESSPGRGSCFSVLLPAANAQAFPETPAEGPIATWRGTGTILVIDDERPVREVARRMLERAGFAVVAAEDARSGIEVYRGNHAGIVAVLLDLSMPGLGGDEVFDALRAIDPAVRVIISSGHGAIDVANRFDRTPPAAFIQKPFRADDFLATFRRVLEPRT